MSLDNITSQKKTSNEVDQTEPMDFWNGLFHAGKFLHEQHQLATREEATSSVVFQRYAFTPDKAMEDLYN